MQDFRHGWKRKFLIFKEYGTLKQEVNDGISSH